MRLSIDETVVDPRPRRCAALAAGRAAGVIAAADSTLVSVQIGHSSIERVHHIDIDEGNEEVKITVWVGTLPQASERMRRGENVVATMELRVWTTEFQLSRTLGDRVVRDGAPDPRYPRRE